MKVDGQVVMRYREVLLRKIAHTLRNEGCYSPRLISSAVDGNWTDWGDWERCSVTCVGGTQSRSRTCTNPPPRYGGRDCSGESEDVQSCNEDPCPSKEILAYSCYLNQGSISISSLKILYIISCNFYLVMEMQMNQFLLL